ncbi:VCBS repeat-containing protein [Streptomyces sp. Q6]|uniref:VCBS repeat-containing protein n=1 Tax=Streptomyces citrinus TaxID=3118173 RepID=A0ACD5AK13_9ACTN
MTRPTLRLSALAALPAVCCALALLTGCGSGSADGNDTSPSPGGSPTGFGAPIASRSPAVGTGSKDPDDLNGDGHRDLLLPLETPGGEPQWEPSDGRLLVVYGSSHGLDPATRSVYGRSDLGLPAAESYSGVERPEGVDARSAASADLDGDGFADLALPIIGKERATDGTYAAQRYTVYVVWGSARGPGGSGGKATPMRLPARAAASGLDSVVRGDFDGDGRLDLAGRAVSGTTAWLLYGPFDRATGAPARTGTLPMSGGSLYADDVDPTGEHPRVTPLLAHDGDDGEQTGSTLYTAPTTGRGRELREGNAHAFGDFDGDGRRDVAVGDDGSRNDEPGAETEAPDVDGSLTVYPGDGGTPVDQELPEASRRRRGFSSPLVYVAADPDGDGRDGILVPTFDAMVLLDGIGDGGGARQVEVARQGPARAQGKKVRAERRPARPYGAADFDGDGRDELVLTWGADSMFGLYGEDPTHWWITDGISDRDRAVFDATRWVKPRVYASPTN